MEGGPEPAVIGLRGAWCSWQGVRRDGDGQRRDRGIQGLEQWWRTRHGGTRGQMGETEVERREETQIRVRDEIFREIEKNRRTKWED